MWQAKLGEGYTINATACALFDEAASVSEHLHPGTHQAYYSNMWMLHLARVCFAPVGYCFTQELYTTRKELAAAYAINDDDVGFCDLYWCPFKYVKQEVLHIERCKAAGIAPLSLIQSQGKLPQV